MELPHDSNLKRLMLLMNQAFEDCSQKVDPLVTERLAEIVYQVMSARYRIFHTVEHLFSTSEGSKGPGVFAAIFHDIVYYQVDKRIHPLLMPHQSEFVLNEKTNECILPDLEKDHWLRITSKIFGFKTGQTLNPMNGLNEFLSAVAAARMLSKTLNDWQIVQVIACIEATIPFRPQTNEQNSFQQLHEKLCLVNQEYQLNATASDLDETLKKCVIVSNQDVCSFYSKDFGEFISGTWNLILENNPIFKNPLYTVIEYRNALQKVRGFFTFLKSENVVHEWGTQPPHSICLQMKSQVSKNLADAIFYLDLKLIEITLLELFATSTGGDAPYFLLIGENTPGSNQAAIERYFHVVKNRVNQQMNEVVYDVLKKGRKAKSSFDFNHSPIAAYLYESLPASESNLLILKAQEYLDAKITPEQYFASFRKELIQPILNGLSEISWSRKLRIN